MRRYETIFIIDPDIGEEKRNLLFEKIKNLIAEKKGNLVFFDEWGAKKLAYEIKKKQRGYYVRLDYCGTGALVAEIERNFKIDDIVLKFMTILLDSKPDLKKIEEEIKSGKTGESEQKKKEDSNQDSEEKHEPVRDEIELSEKNSSENDDKTDSKE